MLHEANKEFFSYLTKNKMGLGTWVLTGFENCWSMKAFGVDSKRSYAFLTVPPIPLVGSVRTKSAPNALIVTLLSKLV